MMGFYRELSIGHVWLTGDTHHFWHGFVVWGRFFKIILVSSANDRLEGNGDPDGPIKIKNTHKLWCCLLQPVWWFLVGFTISFGC